METQILNFLSTLSQGKQAKAAPSESSSKSGGIGHSFDDGRAVFFDAQSQAEPLTVDVEEPELRFQLLQPLQFHEEPQGFFTIPAGALGREIRLRDIQEAEERAIFARILKRGRSEGEALLLLELEGKPRAVPWDAVQRVEVSP